MGGIADTQLSVSSAKWFGHSLLQGTAFWTAYVAVNGSRNYLVTSPDFLAAYTAVNPGIEVITPGHVF